MYVAANLTTQLVIALTSRRFGAGPIFLDLKVHLAIGGGSDAHHLKAFKDRLRSAQEATNQELQENVYK